MTKNKVRVFILGAMAINTKVIFLMILKMDLEKYLLKILVVFIKVGGIMESMLMKGKICI